MLGNEKEDCVLPKQGKNVTGLRYKMTLTDRKDLSKSYQCELRNSISIGRVTGNDIVIDVTGVSKKHCMILNKNGRIFIQDSNSTNGTFVDGEKIHFDTEIFSGTNIRVGKAELIIKLERV